MCIVLNNNPCMTAALDIMFVLCSDLQVESPERVKEGDSVRLTCKSRCALTDRETFIWYRNSDPLTERRDGNNQLLLQPVRREDAGTYSCAVHGHTYISPAVYLNVTCEYRFNHILPAQVNVFKYCMEMLQNKEVRIQNNVSLVIFILHTGPLDPPKEAFIAVSPSGEIVEGDSVTLNCSSDSDPPAEISWFKEGMFVGSGRIYSISKIRSDHSGEYKCKSSNKYGDTYSDAFTLNIMCKLLHNTKY